MTVTVMVDSYESRAVKFDRLRNQKPQPGEVLRSKDGEPVPVYVETKPDFGQGETRVVFTNALIDRECTGWYLTKETNGLKVLVLPHSQERLIELNGGSVENLQVVALRVVRHNEKGTALICELVEE